MIKLAAILTHDGEIYTGKCHAYCLNKIVNYKNVQTEGFVTDEGIFLNRIEAGKHALECGQITNLRYAYGLDSSEVCAKDITEEDVKEDEFNRLIKVNAIRLQDEYLETYDICVFGTDEICDNCNTCMKFDGDEEE
jgi:hypothetical protein